jgi:hypothetical protein
MPFEEEDLRFIALVLLGIGYLIMAFVTWAQLY